MREKEIEFIEKNQNLKKSAVVLDVPLLYESDQNDLCDCVIVAYCSSEIQHQRAAERGFNLNLLDHLLKLHLPLSKRLSKADFSINTDGPLDQTHKKLLEELDQISKRYNISLPGDKSCDK